MKKVTYFCNNIQLELPIKPTETQTKDREYWVKNDFLCKNFIINCLSDDLNNYYNFDKFTKEINDTLQKKYDTKEADIKKYAIS